MGRQMSPFHIHNANGKEVTLNLGPIYRRQRLFVRIERREAKPPTLPFFHIMSHTKARRTKAERVDREKKSSTTTSSSVHWY